MFAVCRLSVSNAAPPGATPGLPLDQGLCVQRARAAMCDWVALLGAAGACCVVLYKPHDRDGH
jgi:hypothetical protein